MDQYPVIKLIVEHGNLIALAIGVLPLLGALVMTVLGFHWMVAVAGAIGAAVVYFLMRSYVELVRVMADMLLPK